MIQIGELSNNFYFSCTRRSQYSGGGHKVHFRIKAFRTEVELGWNTLMVGMPGTDFNAKGVVIKKGWDNLLTIKF